MNWVSIAALSLLCVACIASADNTTSQETLQAKFEKVVGELSEPSAHPTVREAAREYIIGRQLAVQDLHRRALPHFRRAIELDTHSPASWAGMAVSLAAINRDDAAMVAWEEVLIRNPNQHDALLILGLDAAKMGQIEKGKRYLSQHWLTATTVPLESLLRIAGLLSVYEGDSSTTSLLTETLERIVEAAVFDLANGASSPAWRGMVQQLVDLGAIEVALQLVVKAAPTLRQRELGAILTILPVLEAAAGGNGSITQDVYEDIALRQNIPLAPQWNNPLPLFEALSIAAQSMSIISKDPSGPIRLYKASLELQPVNALVLNNLAWITLEQDGPTEEVQKLGSEALKLDPNASYILDTVGWIQTTLGNTEKAIPLLVGSLQTSPQPSAETCVHLGDAYWIDGQNENAIRAWQTASMILHSEEYRQEILDGFVGMAQSVWGITVVTPEALYDFELGEVTRLLEEKLTSVQEGNKPPTGMVIPMNGVD